MNKNKIWVERKFEFDFPATDYPKLIDRLKSTPETLKSLLKNIHQELLTKKVDQQWSVQENVGHLLTVDDLFIGRLDDYENELDELRPADVSGNRTNKANYNSQKIDDILENFRIKRSTFIDRLEKLDKSFFSKSAWHPRLNKPMRLCDMLYFQAEHDDHHVNKIKELAKYFSTG